MSGPAISLKDVTMRFGAVVAVDAVSLEIRRGEFFSLLGPSGCGKTTLLRLLAGLDQPLSGEIMIDGRKMDGVPANLRPTNMVFQNYAIFPHLDVFGNIAYGLRRLKLPQAELRSRVEAALALVKLDGFGSRSSDQLSGGQRQRVALARALVCRPQVLLLDEPLGALDRQLRLQMQTELRELQRTVGITFVNVTHDQSEALSLSDRMAVMATGRILQVGDPSELYDAPASREVARFLGHTNFLGGVVLEASQDAVLVDAGPAGRLRARPYSGAREGMPVTLAIRPEKLKFGVGHVTDNRVTGQYVGRTYLGERCLFHFHVTGSSLPLTVSGPSNALQVDGRQDFGSPVAIEWAAEDVVLLTK